MLEIALYTKADCSLCDEAKAVIQEVQRHLPFSYREIDITTDAAIYEQYREQIPTIFVNGRKAFKFRVTADALIARLRRELARGQPQGD